jgi:hypothetical protein
MAKFLTAFITTMAFLWVSADVVAHESMPAPAAPQKSIGPIVLEKKVDMLKVPANNCIVSGGEQGQILEQYALQCTNRRNWLNIDFADKEDTL